MSRLAPAGPVYQAGTLSGNPLACAAGLASLRLADDAVYKRLDETAATIGALASDALTTAGVPHRLSYAGNMFSIFFTDAEVVDYDSAKTQDVGAFKAFFHAMLARGVYLPPSAFESWFVSTALGRRRDGADRRGAAAGGAGGGERGGGGHERGDQDTVHVLRHGEVYNPSKILYGRLPDFHLSELGRQMAKADAEALADRDVTHVVASPLERAQETAEPIAAQFGLEVATDSRLIESANYFEGKKVSVGDGALSNPRHWWVLRDPITPSWGEAYLVIAQRMFAAVQAARVAAEGHEAVCVSHQLPIWTLRRYVEKKRLWHDPRRRQCGLASLTSFRFEGAKVVGIDYSEPAAHLVADVARRQDRQGSLTVRRLAAVLAAAALGGRRAGRLRQRELGEEVHDQRRRRHRVHARTSARRSPRSPASCSTAARTTWPPTAARSWWSTSGVPGARPCRAEADDLEDDVPGHEGQGRRASSGSTPGTTGTRPRRSSGPGDVPEHLRPGRQGRAEVRRHPGQHPVDADPGPAGPDRRGDAPATTVAELQPLVERVAAEGPG